MSESSREPLESHCAPSARHRTATPPPRLKPLPLANAQEAEMRAETSIQNGNEPEVWMPRKPCDAPMEQPDETPPKRQQWPGIQQRSIIALVLCFCAMLLAMGPAAYCWWNQAGRAELADIYRGGAHPTVNATCSNVPEATPGAHHRPVLVLGSDYVNEVACGGINGLLMMVATVVAGIGIDMPGPHILAMGMASLISYGFSMGFGAFMVEEAKEGFALSQLEEEYSEVRNMPHSEVEEMICHYRKRGLSEEDALRVAHIFSQYEDFWVHHMMAEELGIQMPRGGTAAMKSGLATGTSFLVFGLVPLLGLMISTGLRHCAGPAWYRPQFSTAMSLTLSAFALLLLGALVSRLVGSRTPLVSGMIMLANGFAASIMAFAVSQLLSNELVHSRGLEAASPGPSVPSQPSVQRLCSDSAGSLEQSPRHGALKPGAWPTFRHQFFLSSGGLWVAVCSAIVAWQTTSRAASAFERMHFELVRVFAYGLLTCVTTGLGAVPFLVVKPGPLGIGLAVANAVAAGMMLAASFSMVFEAHEHSGPYDWQLFVGLVAGALFIRASEWLHGADEEEEEGIAALHDALLERKHWRKAMLIFTVMFCHSAAEGIAVGVAFSRQLNHEFGIYISLLLAVHNVPEGLAVALVLVPRGVSATLTAFIAILTSVPQPVLALAAFLFVEVFQGLLPIGLAFSAGAMVYVCLHELLIESMEQLGVTKAVLASSLSFLTMSACICLLQSLTGV